MQEVVPSSLMALPFRARFVGTTSCCRTKSQRVCPILQDFQQQTTPINLKLKEKFKADERLAVGQSVQYGSRRASNRAKVVFRM